MLVVSQFFKKNMVRFIFHKNIMHLKGYWSPNNSGNGTTTSMGFNYAQPKAFVTTGGNGELSFDYS